MSMSTYRVNEIVIRTGTIGGMVAGGLGAVQYGLAPLVAGNPDEGTLHDLGNASMLAGFVTFFLVGFLVRRWTGLVDAAARAGFVAAVITCLLSGLAVAMLSGGASVFVALATLVIQAAVGLGLAMAGALARRPKRIGGDPRTGPQIPIRQGKTTSQPRGRSEASGATKPAYSSIGNSDGLSRTFQSQPDVRRGQRSEGVATPLV